MVTILLLTIIYLAFISLGLPDAIFGVANGTPNAAISPVLSKSLRFI